MGVDYLIDTHILLWWLLNDPKLNTECRDILRNPAHRILVSSVSAWEIATKYRIGKLPEAKQIVEEYSQIIHQAKFIELPNISPCTQSWQLAHFASRSFR